MKIYILISLFTIGFSLSSLAQTSLSDLMKSVERNNPELIAGTKKLIETGAFSKLGRNPMDPELEYGRNFNDSDGGHELSLEQSFEFPTIYRQRNIVANYTVQKAEMEFKSLRMQILSRVTELYVTAVAANTKLELLNNRVKNALLLKKFFEKKLEQGETTILEKNKVTALYVNSRSEVMMAQLELQNILNQLKQMNGGAVVLINTVVYPNFSSVENALNIDQIVNNSYDLKATTIDSLIANSKLKIAKQEWIPNLMVGYRAEIGGVKFKNGIVAGISIPLWGKRGNVKFAKAQKETLIANHNQLFTSQKSELENLVRSMSTYKDICRDYTEYLTGTKTEDLLIKSLEKGAITMTDYLVELSLLYDTLDLANDAEKSLYITKAQMTRFLAL